MTTIAMLALTVTPVLTSTSAVPAARAAEAPSRCEDLGRVYIPTTPFPLLRLGARRVWQRSTGSGVVVAVVDSGVDVTNPHLAGVVLPGVSLLPGDPDKRGWTDQAGHGTAVAGVIAAKQVAGSGVLGLAYGARILPVRIYAGEDEQAVRDGVGLTTERIAAGIRIAAERGAAIINVSISQVAPDPRLDAAVAYAHSRGALVVASAGNRNTSVDKRDVPRYPGASPFALAVGAVNTSDGLSPDSVAGPHVDVLGPGAAVATAFRNKGDCLIEGFDASTSLATGYVSAAAALIKQVYPKAGPDEVAYRLMASAARPVQSARDDGRGWGLIQPLEAITMTLDPDRPGPPLPGQVTAPVQAKPIVQHLDVQPKGDPTRPQRDNAVWLLLLGGLGVALALLAGRMVAARTGPSAANR